jgi:hypothetical protein
MFDFPDAPAVNDEFVAIDPDLVYVWSGVVWDRKKSGDNIPPAVYTPVITSVVPDTISADGVTHVIEINGTNFNPITQVLQDGVVIASAYVSPTKLTATIVAPSAEGSDEIMVSDTIPLVSNEETLTYFTPPLPPGTMPPLIVACVPDDLSKFVAAVHVMTVTGTQFEEGTVVMLNGVKEGSCEVTSATSLQWTLDITNLPEGQYKINTDTPPFDGTNPDLNLYIRTM